MRVPVPSSARQLQDLHRRHVGGLHPRVHDPRRPVKLSSASSSHVPRVRRQTPSGLRETQRLLRFTTAPCRRVRSDTVTGEQGRSATTLDHGAGHSGTMMRTRLYAAGLLALAVLLAGCSSGGGKHGSPTTKSTSPSTKPFAVSVVVDGSTNPPPLSAAQLDAHLGKGLPADWTPVDFGDARLWYPPGWQVVFGSCLGSAIGWINTDTPYDETCLSAPSVIRLAPPSRTPVAGTPTRTIHGYDLYSTTADSYVVPQLQVAITVRGHASQRILATLAPSSRAIASIYRGSPPASSHAITSQGLTFKVPPSWGITTIGAMCSFSYSKVVLPTPVPPPIGSGPECTGDYRAYSPPLDGGLEVARLQVSPAQPPKPSAVNIWEAWYTLHLGIAVQVDPNHAISMQLGVERDGRVAAEVIHSIHKAEAKH